MRIVSFALIAGLVLAGCQSELTDGGGRPMTLRSQEATIYSSPSWLPDPVIRWAETYTSTLRDNTHPIVNIDLQDRKGRFRASYLSGQYTTFSRITVEDIQQEENFRNRLEELGLSDHVWDVVKIGNPFSRTGGWFALFGSGRDTNCVYSYTGAGLGTAAASTAPRGRPYDTVFSILFCGTVAEREEVIEFIQSPRPVDNREQFREHVDSVQQDG